MDIKTIFETPFDYESYIENWLLSIEDMEERTFARKYLAGSLKAMMGESERAYQALENRVYDEIKEKPNIYSLYMTVVKREKYDITNGSWFPVLPREELPFEKKREALPEALPMTLAHLYCEGSEDVLFQLEALKERRFSGSITVKDIVYEAGFQLVPNIQYRRQIESLYQLFQANGIPWITVNCGYLLRFFALRLTEVRGNVQSGQEVQDYTVNLEELAPHLDTGYLPVWNLQHITYDSNQFVRPAIDAKYYEHSFPLERFGKEDGYLMEGNRDILSIRRTEDEILIMTMQETFQKWKARRIIHKPPLDLYCFEKPILHNAPRDSFVAGFTNDSGMLLRSRLEIIRQANRYDFLGFLTLKDVVLLTDTTEPYDRTHLSVMNVSPVLDREHRFVRLKNLNWFLQDDLINRASQKILLFQFKTEQQPEACYDLICFILSEMQRSFIEYRCEAEIVDSSEEAVQ